MHDLQTSTQYQLLVEIEGMSCASCVARIEQALQQIPTLEATVNIANETAMLISQQPISLAEVVAKIEHAGFSVRTQSLDFAIGGMSCASCSARIERGLKKYPGVIDAAVNLANETATLRGLSSVQRNDVIQEIERIGFQVIDEHVELSIEGMTCASCVARVEKALKAVEGVSQAQVNLATEIASVQGGQVLDLIAAVEKSGFLAQLRAQDDSQQFAQRKQQEESHLKRDFGLALLLALPVFILEMGSHLIPSFHHWVDQSIGMQNSWYIQFVLTSLVLIFPGRRFYQLGIPALLRKMPDMNSLVAVGTLAAFAYSVVATFFPSLLPDGTVNVYFEAAAVIVALILLGRALEARAKGKTSQAIQYLMGLQPKTAHVLQQGQVIEMPIALVQRGMQLEIRPGERIPVDADVIAGQGYVDEAMMSGEAIPIEKQPGHRVIGGTMNQNGHLIIQATDVGQHSVLANIIRMVEQAQGAKLPIQTLVDQVTLWFVPAVMGIALFTFIIWWFFGPTPSLSYALVNAVAVLIIACPCAMGLATPTSIMVGTGRGAELGVLFRKGEALQQLKDIQVVAVDKTGTLTAGQPTLTDLQVLPEFDEAQVLQIIASVEAKSEHPIAYAILRAAEDLEIQLLAVDAFDSITGAGIQAQVNGQAVFIGAARLMQELNLDISDLEATAQEWADQAKTPLYAAIDGKLAALLAVADPLKDTTFAAIKRLHQQGLKVAMITGDHQHTANAIASQLQIDTVIAEVLPHEKVAAVQRLQQQAKVAFVGDGINDAPALAQADVGIAIGTGTDIAIESADVVLMSGNMQGVATAIELSHATIRNIQQNLFWAFLYNILLIPVAAGVLYPIWGTLLSPVFAAAAMALSSVFVLSNALRLKRFRSHSI